MFPVRRELVGKRFAYIHGNGRSGTRHRGSVSGLDQNWDALSWVTGTILASNVDGLDAQNESVFVKRVKVFVEYDGKYQLPKEWIKLYSGSHRVFLIEENLVLCRRNDGGIYGQQSYSWPALRMVPVLDRNFLDENPHLIPVEYMGARKQLSFVVFEDIIQLFPSEDQTIMLESIQKDKYLKEDYQRWERIQKTQMILLFGPYSLTGCRVEIIDTSNGRCFRAVIISHDYMKRVVDVMDDQLLKSRKVNPKLIHINFLASDEEIDRLMYGEAPKAIPTRYSRYGHNMQSTRSQMDAGLTGDSPSLQLRQFTLPQWMTNNVLVNQDQYENPPVAPHEEYQQENGLVCSPPNSVLPFRDDRQLESNNISLMNTPDRGRQMLDLQDGMQQKQEQIGTPYNDAQLHPILASKSGSSSTNIIMSPIQQSSHLPPMCPSPLHKALYPKDKQHFRSPASSAGSPASLMDFQTQERTDTAPCIDTSSKKRFSPNSRLSSPKGQVAELYSSFSRRPNNFENPPFNYDGHLQLGSSHPLNLVRDGSTDKWSSPSQQSTMSQLDRSFTDFHRRSSLPEGLGFKERPDLHNLQNAASSSHLADAFTEQRAKLNLEHRIPFEQSLDRATEKSLQQMPLGNITENDLSHFLNQLDASVNAPLRTSPNAQSMHIHSREHLQAVRSMLGSALSNTESPRDEMLSHFQQKLARYYSQFQKLEQADPRQLKVSYEHRLAKQYFDRLHATIPSQRRNCPSAPPLNLSRSLSMDNFHPAAGQFSMSPPSGVLKKPRAKRPPRKPKREKSKDDTAKPSIEATKKVSSLISGQLDKTVEPNTESNPDTKVVREGYEQRKPELLSEKLDSLSLPISGSAVFASSEHDGKTSKFPENEQGRKQQDEPGLAKNVTNGELNAVTFYKDDVVCGHKENISNQDIPAQVALAAARGTEGSQSKTANEEVPLDSEGQKLPSEALWFENTKDGQKTISSKNATGKRVTDKDNETGGKSNKISSNEILEQPPSPEFLPMKDKESEILFEMNNEETSVSGGVQTQSQPTASPKISQPEVSPQSLKEKEMSGRTPNFGQEKIEDGRKISQSNKLCLPLAEYDSVKEDIFPETKTDSSETKVDSAVSSQINDTGEKRGTLSPKVPTASLPFSSLGINVGTIFSGTPREDKDTKIVRNMYGRTLYHSNQKGPSLPHQLRTDKIIQDLASPGKKISELQHQQPHNESSNVEHLKQKEGTTGEKLELNEQEKILHSSTPALREMLTDVTKLAEKKSQDNVTIAENNSDKLTEKPIRIKGEQRKRKCRHKRKPCKCDALQQQSDEQQRNFMADRGQGMVMPFANLPFYSQAQENLNVSSAPSRSDERDSATAKDFSSFEESLPIEYQQPNLINSSERQPYSTMHFHEPSFSVIESKEVGESTFTASPASVSNPALPSRLPPSLLQETPFFPTQQEPSIPSAGKAQSFSGVAEGTSENVFKGTTDVNQAGTHRTIHWKEKTPGQVVKKKAKCRHKRKPCKCEIEAAAMVDAHLNLLRYLDQTSDVGSGGRNMADIPKQVFNEEGGEASTTSAFAPPAVVVAAADNDASECPFVLPGQHKIVHTPEPSGDSSWTMSQPEITLPSFAEISKMAVKALNPDNKTLEGNELTEGLMDIKPLKASSSAGVSDASSNKQGVITMPNVAPKIEGTNISSTSNANQPLANVNPSTLPANSDNDSSQVKTRKKTARSSSGRKCRHKRKPCRCDAESAMVHLESLKLNTAGEIPIAHLRNEARESLSSLLQQSTGPITGQVKPNTEDEATFRIPKDHNATSHATSHSTSTDVPSEKSDEDIKLEGVGLKNNGKYNQKLVDTGGTLKTSTENRDVLENNLAGFAKDELTGNKDKSSDGKVITEQSTIINGSSTNEKSSSIVANLTNNFKDEKSSVTVVNPTEDKFIQTQLDEMEVAEKQKISKIDKDHELKGEDNRMPVAGTSANGLEIGSSSKRCIECNESDVSGKGEKAECEDERGWKQEFEQRSNIVETCKAVLANMLDNVTMFEKKVKGTRRRTSKPKDVEKSVSVKSSKAKADTIKPRKDKDVAKLKKSQEKSKANSTVGTSKAGDTPRVSTGTSPKEGPTEGPNISTGSAFTISVPTTISLPTDLLNNVGSRLTARAKIVCPEKNLLPLKGTPVNVSFDGGKTFTLANIIGIRNGNQSLFEGSKTEGTTDKSMSDKDGNGSLKQVLETDENKQMKQKNVIDAVVLGVSKADSLPEEPKETGKKLEEESSFMLKKKLTSKKVMCVTDNSSNKVDLDDDALDQEREKERKVLKEGQKKRRKKSKELRRSNRFRRESDSEMSSGKPQVDDDANGIPPNQLVDCLFPLSESENSGDLSDDPSYNPVRPLSDLVKRGEKKKLALRKGPDEKEQHESDKKSLESAAVSAKTPDSSKRTTETSKDEMFDCCDIHKNLFCPKCLPFREVEGLWPAASRAKEVNTAWRKFNKQCEKHGEVKCAICRNCNTDKKHQEFVVEHTTESSKVKHKIVKSKGSRCYREESRSSQESFHENQTDNESKKRDKLKDNQAGWSESGSLMKSLFGGENGSMANDNRRLRKKKNENDSKTGIQELDKDNVSENNRDSEVKKESCLDNNVDESKHKTSLLVTKAAEALSDKRKEQRCKAEKSEGIKKKRKLKDERVDAPEECLSPAEKKAKSSLPKFELPMEQCLIHGRFRCAACKSFFEADGRWPGWARRGEVRYRWEKEDSTRKNRMTVKCRIHLRAKCPKCLPFRSKKGIWPSYLRREEVEMKYEMMMKKNETKEGGQGEALENKSDSRKTKKSTEVQVKEKQNGKKEVMRRKREDAEGARDGKDEAQRTSRRGRKRSKANNGDCCIIHETAFCLWCYELKLKLGFWPTNVKAVKKNNRKRLKEKALTVEQWKKCVIHQDKLCLQCFCFWEREGRAPDAADEKQVTEMQEKLEAEIGHKKCDVHGHYMCPSCVPVYITEGKLPPKEDHLDSIYSWKLFEGMAIQESSSKKQDEAKKKEPQQQKVTKYSMKVAKKYYCVIHHVYPCFICMPKFIENDSWPNEENCEITEQWPKERIESIKCSEHNKMFCRRCNKMHILFEKYAVPGVTDQFRTMVMENMKSRRDEMTKKARNNMAKGRIPFEQRELSAVKERKRKRENEESSHKDEELDEKSNLSVSFSGRVRNMVSRPGTVDISKLADDFIERGSESGTGSGNKDLKNPEKLKAKAKSVVGNETEVPIKRKRGRPPKRRLEGEDPVPKKKKKFALIDKLRDGSIKIVNVEDLYEQLRSERPRDPSPAHLEYIQFLENAEKMNVKYFAIHDDEKAALKAGDLKKDETKATVAENSKQIKENTDKDTNVEETVREVQDTSVDEPKQDVSERKENTANETSGIATKIDGLDSWSEKDVALIIERVEKAAEAAKQQKEAASQKRKHKKCKKPLTVAQVLAIKRSKGADAMPVMDKGMQKDLEKMLVEAGRRKVDLDTVLEEALKAKDKKAGMKKRGRKPVLHKTETFLQERPCSQTPKLPKCRDCRIVDKRDADQHAFCRFVMFRRLLRKIKTGKLESAGFCSPQAATLDAFGPWTSKAKDVDMRVAVCHYIIKNIAGQFCAVVEEECNALLLGTKDGAVGWKRAVAGVREMCDACATTIFNIHWVCEKCGFGVCLDCYRSKITEQEVKDEGDTTFEFHWISCAPGLAHKPRNMTVTQIIPENALWELCQSTIDICTALGVPFKLSENVLKMAMPLREAQEKTTPPKSISSTSHMEDVCVGSPTLTASNSNENPDQLVFPRFVSDSEIKKSQYMADIATPTKELITPIEKPNENIAELTVLSSIGPCLNCPNKDSPNHIHTANSECDIISNGPSRMQENSSLDTANLISKEGETPANISTSIVRTVKSEATEDPIKETVVGDENGLVKIQELLPGRIEVAGEKTLKAESSIVFGGFAASSKGGFDERIVEERNQLHVLASCEDGGKSRQHIKEEVNAGDENEHVESRDEKAYEYYHSICETALSVARAIQTWKDASEKMVEPDEFSGSDDYFYEKPDISEPGCEGVIRDKETGDQGDMDVSGNDKGVEQPPSANEGKSARNENYFGNSLDILAMVASGIFNQDSKKDKINSNDQDENTVKDDKTVKSPSVHPETFVKGVARDCPVASYLCDGALLQLNYSRHPENVRLFRNVWKKGFPLIVSRVDELMDKSLWRPESFANEFGSELVDVVNCRSGQILHQFSVGDFWKGFESVKDRPVDSQDLPMLLKLKDWPPGDDFRDKMPKRFEDLMNAIPLPDYTRRDGQWNLVSRLPTNHFIKPDLGPKMYNAYGSAAVPSAGTTNLHLDMSDAVNVMVYVGVPRDPLLGEQEKEDALKTVEIACCDKTIERVRQPDVLPGALWHIYAAEDADKIRKFLRKVAEERKLKYSIHNDPIHDQSFYLDHELRKRLKAEFGVTGFAICQCLGDAVFIPAGAPHQVLNLHSCVKVAEDFVSPERIGQCFNLTQEFRYLSDRHTNHEDKLQVKNIIYHAVKDSVAVLKESLRRQNKNEL